MSQLHDWIDKLKNLDLEQMQQTLERLSEYGPLPGILLPFVEAFLPFLPLIVIIAANVNIYGLGVGFLLSWIGVTAGKVVLFLICRNFGKNVKSRIEKKYPKSERFFNWIDRKGFSPLFLLSSFPFTPSVVITVVAGLSRVPFHTFFLATVLGKAVMILIISLISFDISHAMQQPWRFVVITLTIVILWFGGKKLETRYQLK